MAARVDQRLHLQWRPFVLPLPRPLRNAKGCISAKRGWLLQLRSHAGAVGWGEAAPLAYEAAATASHDAVAEAIRALGPELERADLEARLASPGCPPAVAFALGAALAELDGLIGSAGGGWLMAPAGAQLLPAGEAAVGHLEQALFDRAGAGAASTFKWKVAAAPDGLERELLEQLLARLPAGCRLRLDANGGWDRSTAQVWAQRLGSEPRLQWLEQPLAPDDHAGLEALAAQVPVALDESLTADPRLRQRWPGWQVRRPSQEGDPRPLLAALTAAQPHLVLSTAFESGIGRRWLHHLAALQSQGSTPAAPGLAQAWQPSGALLSSDPALVWEAAA